MDMAGLGLSAIGGGNGQHAPGQGRLGIIYRQLVNNFLVTGIHQRLLGGSQDAVFLLHP